MMRSPEIRNLVVNQMHRVQPSSGGASAWHVPAPGTQDSTIGFQFGSKLPDMVGDRPVLKPVGSLLNNMGDDHVATTAIGAGLGALAGAGVGMLRGNAAKGALLGAGLGGGGSLLLSYLMRHLDSRRLQRREAFLKASAFYGVDYGGEMQFIESRLFGDGSLSAEQKSSLMSGLQSLTPMQLKELSRMVRGVMGAGIGYVIARYLMGLGVGGSAIGALTGGAIGLLSGRPSNAFGQRPDTRSDVFGRRRLLS